MYLYAPKTAANNWYPMLLKREEIISMWDNDHLCSEVQHWKGEPLESWFRDLEKTELLIGRATFLNNSLGFINGRHRTRWLLQEGYDFIPILMTSDSMSRAIEEGIYTSRTFEGVEI